MTMVKIDRLAYGGDGIGRLEDGRVVFVPRTAPGDVCEIEVLETKKRHAVGRLVRVAEPGPDRVDPACPHYEECGGCQLMHIDLAAQRRIKETHLRDAMERIAKIEPNEYGPFIETAGLHYRNKIALHWSSSKRRWGLVAPDHVSVSPIDKCLLLEADVQAAMDEAVAKQYPPDRDGLVVRSGTHTQVNTRGAQRLYEVVIQQAALTGTERVLDLYCGSGGIALALAPHCDVVWGFDTNVESIAWANEAAEAAGITNATFNVHSADDLEGTGQFDVVIVDPPRAGLQKPVFGGIKQVQPSRLVYVSCNPTTLARDAAILERRGFVFRRLQGIDLFPQTYHLEAIATFERPG